jgi:hypothetical protein
MGFPPASTQIGSITDGLITSWTVATPLEPATEYFWRVVAYVDGVEGPYSDVARFWTGPVCSPGSLVAPTLTSPVDLGVGTVSWQPLTWEYPDSSCVPDYFEAQLRPATDTTFSGLNMMDTPDPGIPATAQIPREELSDCTGYIWRVRAVADGTEGPWSDVFHFHTDFDGICEEESIYDFYPVCDTADLLAPIGIYPPPFAIIPELLPSFTWEYPESCFPEGYVIDVTTYGDFSVGTISGATGNADTTWGTAIALEPATKYQWRVAPINGITLGPYSLPISFWTGPLCATADLVAPVLVEPENAHEVDTLTPTFHWEYPEECVPETYEWGLSTDPSFATYVQFLDLPVLADYILLLEDEPLLDCTIYFWRVRADNSTGFGPYSTTFNFYTNVSGSCPSVAPSAPEEVSCPAGQVYNEDTESCESRACSSIHNPTACEANPNCYWEPKLEECRDNDSR